jgi:hypothetical protein
MDTLEIELACIQELIDEEVELLVEQFLCWEDLENCEVLFDLDISDIPRPLEVLPDLVMRKADERLPEAKAERFKAAWRALGLAQQVEMAIKLCQPS